MEDNNESETSPAESGPNRWQKLWRRPKKWFLFGIPAGGFVMFAAGIVFWGGFNTALELSSTLTFCTSCHEMSVVHEEWQQSVHYQNAAGVRATCADCHVPKAWGPKVLRKMRATINEVPNWALGTIDTPEKFEAHREELALRVWDEMRANNSRECRNCHSLESMNLELQDRSARRRHTLEYMQEKGETCIDCHQGVAHQLPEGY